MRVIILLSFFGFGLLACQSNSDSSKVEDASIEENANPAAPGFNEANSDAKAIAIADEVMTAMGGRKYWDETQCLVWNFFGRRKLFWDKQSGNVRIESYPDSTTYLINVFTDKGKVKKGDEELSHPDSLALYTKRGKSIWINDSYWLVMPFKLKDSGVTLKYVEEDTTLTGAKADILQLTFEEVGDTPNNKYLVYVDKTSKLVTQWDFFTNYEDEEPRFSTPWADYKPYGTILLSGNRGRSKLSEIGCFTNLPESVFQDFAAVNTDNFQ